MRAANSFKPVLTSMRASVENAFVYSPGVSSSAAVTIEGITESFTEAKHVEIADGVNGAVIASRDIFVTCALSDFALLDKILNGSAVCCCWVVAFCAGGAVSRVAWNCSERTREVSRRL